MTIALHCPGCGALNAATCLSQGVRGYACACCGRSVSWTIRAQTVWVSASRFDAAHSPLDAPPGQGALPFSPTSDGP